MKKTLLLFLLCLSALFIAHSPCQAQNDFRLWGLSTGGGEFDHGTIFSIDTAGIQPVEEHSFFEIDGDSVYFSTLCEAPNGLLYGMTARGGANDLGVLFEYDPYNKVYTNKISFDGPNMGSKPWGSLLLAGNGKLYGMTSSGGIAGLGVIFEYDALTNNFIKKHDFGGMDGSRPHGSLIQAANGLLYGLTYNGGNFNVGVLFEFDINTGTFNKKYEFEVTAGMNPNADLIQAPNGKLYGLTQKGGLYSAGALFEYDITADIFTGKYNFSGTDGSTPMGNLVLAQNGLLYGVTPLGGSYMEGVLFEYNFTLDIFNSLIDFDSANYGSRPFAGLMAASNGNLYGITTAGGAYNKGGLFEFNPLAVLFTKKLDFICSQHGCSHLGKLMEAANGIFYGMSPAGGKQGHGVLYSFDPSTDTYEKELDFQDPLYGNSAAGSLLPASNGKIYGLTSDGGKYGYGVLFEFDPVTQTYIVKVDFDSISKGGRPFGSLIEASNGLLYGMASMGGTNNMGILFSYNAGTGALVKLFDFTGTVSGANPYGDLLQDLNGKLYGMTRMGGTYNMGVIFEYDPGTASFIKKVDFDGNTNGKFPYGSLVYVDNGKLYGMTSEGGANNMGLLFVYSPGATSITVKKVFDGTALGANPTGNVIRTPDDKLYGLTCFGGVNNSGVLFEYDLVTQTLSKKLDFDDTLKGRIPYGSLLRASNGKLYGLTSRGGSNNDGVLFEYNHNTATFTKIYDLTPATGANPFYTTLTEICSPPTYINPVNVTACPGSNVIYTVNATGNGLTFQWQVDFGMGFSDLSDNSTYSGTNSDTLHISNVSTDMSGYTYQCLIFSACPFITVVTDEATLAVHNVTPLVNGLDSLYCFNDPPALLTASPSGGTYSGAGISDSLFYPSVAGTGTHQIIYSLTDSIGCVFSDTLLTAVGPQVNVVIGGLNSFYCADSPVEYLTGNPPGGVFSGPGMSGNIFNPAAAGEGTHSIIYTFNDNGCDFSDTLTTTVSPLAFPSISGLDPFYCSNAAEVNIDGDPPGGIFAGPGMSGSLFNPTVAGPGTWDIIYTYLTGPGCEYSDTVSVTVGTATPVTLSGTDSAYCLTSAPVTLSGTPSGGLFSGPGMSGNSFSPLAAGGGIHNIIYTYTDADNCIFADTVAVTVHAVNVSFSGLLTAYCVSSPPSTLTGNPTGGSFSGPGISGNVFNPSAAGVGNHPIVYSYTDIYNCTYSDTSYTTVQSSIAVEINGLNTFYCINALASSLTGNPSGGIFNGAGISGNTFDPGAAGPGAHMILYNYSAGPGCTFADTAYTTVGSETSVSFTGLDSIYCLYSSAATLTGSPPGGTFSGEGVIGNVFDPDSAGYGIHMIIYSFSDLNNCIFSDTLYALVDLCSGSSVAATNKNIIVRPNPSDGHFFVELPSSEKYNLSIYNILGERVLQQNNEDKATVELQIENVSAGIFFLKIENETTSQTLRLVIR